MLIEERQNDILCIHSPKGASCTKAATGLLPCCQDAFASLSPGRLDDNKSAASGQQACCKLIVRTFYVQAKCKLFQQLAASLQISCCLSLN